MLHTSVNSSLNLTAKNSHERECEQQKTEAASKEQSQASPTISTDIMWMPGDGWQRVHGSHFRADS